MPLYLPGISASPQDDTGLSGKSSAPFSRWAIFCAEMASLKCSFQAKVEQRRHSVFPVPVGLSKIPFTFLNSEKEMKHW